MDEDENAFISMDELIRKMPLYNAKMSAVDFDYRWKHWQREVITRLDEGEFSSHPELTRLASILSGSEEAFSELVPHCETWYQWLVGKLLYTCPDVKVYDLSYHAEQAIAKFGGLAQMTSLDSVILAAIETDIAQVIGH